MRSIASAISALGLIQGLLGCAVDDRTVAVASLETAPLQPMGGSDGSPPSSGSSGAGGAGAALVAPPTSSAGASGEAPGAAGMSGLPNMAPAPAAMGALNGLSLERLDPNTTGVAFERATCSVAKGGDINGDGRSDFLASTEGAAYALFRPAQLGPVDLTDIPNLVPGIALDLLNDGCGTIDMAPGGDVNGDGFDDFIVASSYRRYGATAEGAVFVVFGGAVPRNVDAAQLDVGAGGGFVIRGPGTNGLRGAAKGAGDLNGDGLDDILISGSQGTFVVFGKRDFAVVALADAARGAAGFTYVAGAAVVRGGVANLGDVNGDGSADLALGDSFAEGQVFVTWGGNVAPGTQQVDVRNGFVINGAQNGDAAGEIVGAAGDVNGDGIPDILINGGRGTSSPKGPLAFLVFGKRDPAPVELAAIEAGQGGGFAIGRGNGDANVMLSAAGDVNGDGLGDMLFDSFNAGRTYVLFGRREVSPVALEELNPRSVRGLTLLTPGGISADGVGDVNGDGRGDVIVGAAAGMRVVYGPGSAL